MYESMAPGAEPQAACDAGVGAFPRELSVGVIAVGREAHGVAVNGPMAHPSVVDWGIPAV